MDKFSDPNVKVTQNKISVHLSGGLGNQMFQYMAGCALSEKTGKRLLLNQNWFLNPRLLHRNNPAYGTKRKMDSLQFCTVSNTPLEHFPTPRDGRFERIIANKSESKLRRFGIATEDSFTNGEWQKANNIRRLVGFFMSPKYFLGLSPHKVFNSLAVPLSSWVMEFLQKLEHQRSIAVHIRLGDYRFLGDKVIPQENYFMSGIELLRANLGPKAKTFFFSDEPKNLQLLFPNLIGIGEIVSHPPNLTPVENLILLSKCESFVCSNSTFSWWASTLSKAPPEWIVRPSYFFTDAPDIDTQKDLWHPNSHKIHPLFGKLVP